METLFLLSCWLGLSHRLLNNGSDEQSFFFLFPALQPQQQPLPRSGNSAPAPIFINNGEMRCRAGATWFMVIRKAAVRDRRAESWQEKLERQNLTAVLESCEIRATQV